MAGHFEHRVVLGLVLVGSLLLASGATDQSRAAIEIGSGLGDLPPVETVLQPPLPMTPGVRAGFPLHKVSDYGVAPADFDGDGRADLSVKLDGGTWKIDYAANGFGSWDRTLAGFGGLDCVPLPADYDGDGRADLAVKDDTWGVWKIDYASNGFGAWDVQIGNIGDRSWRAVPADYDHDGRADLAVKSDAGRWQIDYARDGFGAWNAAYVLLVPGADPVPADYDGDGFADLAVKSDDGIWRIDYAAGGFGTWNVSYAGFGGASAHAVPADYDGDGRADLAVKDDTGEWRIDNSSNGFGAIDMRYAQAGGVTARAVAADFNGDGRADRSVRMDCGPWFIDYSSSLPYRRERFDHMTASGLVTATNAATLAYTLGSDFQGTIFVPSGTTIDLTGQRELPVKSCVTIKGTRRGLDPGALVYTNDRAGGFSFLAVRGHDVRIEGLRLRGPSNGDRDQDQPEVSGIYVAVEPASGWGGNVTVDNDEMWYWTLAAVTVYAGLPRDAATLPPGKPVMRRSDVGLIRVTHNSLHHNSRDELGYGVNVSGGAHATIEANLFDYNRHAVASDGEPHTGYVARFNYVLDGGYTEEWGYYNQHFDVHGTGGGWNGGSAGEYYDISFNTFRGEQSYALFATRPAFMLRGTPTIGAYLRNNVLSHDDRSEAIRITSPDCLTTVGGIPTYSYALCHLTGSGNDYDEDTSQNLGVGDFDGDGRDDVFLANGTGWWYSSAGRTDWRFLRASDQRIATIRLGQFDGVATTDVFYKQGNTWYFSSGGSGDPQLLRSETAPLGDLLFGDFDGNGRTDVIYANGTSWLISRDASQPFAWIGTSSYRPSSLRVGKFDANATDDVMAVANGQWSVSWGAATAWQRLNAKLTSGVGSLVVGDFDGDGRDDLAQTNGSGWRYSRNGSSAWASLRGSGGQPEYASIRDALLGRFGTDAREDAIRYELIGTPISNVTFYSTGSRFVGWDGTQDAFTMWAPDTYVR